jgi:hypothetical protein
MSKSAKTVREETNGTKYAAPVLSLEQQTSSLLIVRSGRGCDDWSDRSSHLSPSGLDNLVSLSEVVA